MRGREGRPRDFATVDALPVAAISPHDDKLYSRLAFLAAAADMRRRIRHADDGRHTICKMAYYKF